MQRCSTSAETKVTQDLYLHMSYCYGMLEPLYFILILFSISFILFTWTMKNYVTVVT